MWKKILIWLGLRSKCCNAPMVYAFGYSYKEDHKACSCCESHQIKGIWRLKKMV